MKHSRFSFKSQADMQIHDQIIIVFFLTNESPVIFNWNQVLYPLNYAELLAQVKSNGYTEKYQGRGKKIILPGIGFSSNEKKWLSGRRNTTDNDFFYRDLQVSLWLD